MKHTPLVGDKFNLLGMEWIVTSYHLHAHMFGSEVIPYSGRSLWLKESDAEKLDWIIPKLTIPLKTREAIKEKYQGVEFLIKFLDSLEVTDEIVLRAGEYVVNVTYATLPAMAELERQFSKYGVSALFNGSYTWEKHESYRDDDVPGDKIFLVKHFDRRIESEAAIREMDPQGYRPATHLEAYAFSLANPELQRQFWIVALGSSTVCDGRRYVAVLDSSSGERALDDSWFGGGWGSDGRFLFVRK